MSIDGSFNLQSAIQRFLARCPELQCIPKLKFLLQKGEMIEEEEVVNSLAGLFVNSKYTIPMMGCFRPIVEKIVDKVVALLRLVPSLKTDTEVVEMMEVGAENDVYVIEEYVRSGQGLKLHELACLAFCRALDLAPFLLKIVLSYFKFAPPPFGRLLASSLSLEKNGSDLLGPIQTSLRFLLLETQIFSKLWDWSSFMDLVQHCSNVDAHSEPEYLKNILDIRWCGIQILSMILKLSDRATVKFGLDAEESLLCLFRWEGFCQDVSVEKSGCYIDATGLEMVGHVDHNSTLSQDCALQSFVSMSLAHSSLNSHVFELLRKNVTARDEKFKDNPFFLTSALKKSFEIVLLAVGQKWPVLLYGPTGVGKTALINRLAQLTGNQVLSIHMDEQMDGKTLIGSYVCAERPGEFRWQPGSFTQALMAGLWVVFEDIDKAPSDVQAILLPLLEGSSSFLTGRGEVIGVSERFRMFATVSNLKNDITSNLEGMISLGALWRRVAIGPPSHTDLFDIINAWYPNLEAVTGKLIETYERVNSASSYGLEGFQSFGRFSLRDLLKWCKRINNLGFTSCGLSVSAYECKSIYQEAVDIFATSSASFEYRLMVMKDIAKIWAVPAAEAEALFPHNKPIIQDLQSNLQVGRVILNRDKTVLINQSRAFVNIRSSLHVLERIACSVKYNEPVLLVGETGTGKTTLVQSLAARLGQPITVLNLSQQSDAADLVGGLKPTDPRFVFVPLYNEFVHLFSKTFSVKDNKAEGGFLDSLQNLRITKDWTKMSKVFHKGVQKVLKYYSHEVGGPGSGTKRKRPLGEEVLRAWEEFSVKLNKARQQIDCASSMTFSFVEGAFVDALRKGHWILLDEVNLAPPDTLQRIKGVLEGENGSLCLAERGDITYIDRHPNFRIFACMNPATDSGKHDLPYSLRSRFTEYFVDDVLDEEDLTLFVKQFMGDSHHSKEMVHKIVHFYRVVKKESEERLQDGANQKPHFSLRSLYRALEYMKKGEKKFGFMRALYDGLCMFFLTLLDGPSAKYMNNIILSCLFGGKMPSDVPFNEYLAESMELSKFSKPKGPIDNYILTDSVKEHLRNLSRAILIKRYPVLLQGPTSSGKTSLVQYLASVTGHEFVRINNHEHTDIQEYLGSYVTDANGKLVFQEGALVKAVRSGWWIVLDELNLAPSDVLEALNRLLDDNRELFVPDLQEVIQAHPKFMLFATQNPPTFYGGRKMLSRAFRNRFVEIHVDEIPEDELNTILEKRCKIPLSYARKMVEVMKDLQLHRQSSKVFAGKHGFITPRDLFRWADRYRILGNSCEDLVKDGYYLLSERLRDENEKNTVQEILEKRFRVKLVKDDLYMQGSSNGIISEVKHHNVSEHCKDIIWTRSMRRLYFLIERCFKMREPVLLVGETGGGKTTVCQLLSFGLGLELHILNCHQHTETSDFLGGFYPVRRSRLAEEFQNLVKELTASNVFLYFPGPIKISFDIGEAASSFEQLNTIIQYYRQGKLLQTDITTEDLDSFERMTEDLSQVHQKWQTIFTWQDGPLVQAMKEGDLFLLDEISLADDSVLERLNSVLEPERKLSLAEKGGSVLETITAHPNFFLLATMNPGGDYGKKELSPALRNRFTEIWVPPVSDLNELHSIARQRFAMPTLPYVDPMLSFWKWFNQLQMGRKLTVRDLLSWVDFMNIMERDLGSDYAFLHGAFLVLLDGLSLGTGLLRNDAGLLREQCLSFLLECLKLGNASSDKLPIAKLETYGWGNVGKPADVMSINFDPSEHRFGINPFYIDKGNEDCKEEGFEFLAPTTCRNAMRLLRAMQVAKPVLLEGSPGVGKTSLVVAVGNYSGHKVVRINLSEQTDIMDLLGSDLPVEDMGGMKFAWSDGILLQALKKGCWVLLDELNLAPQSVLEGLNAILDHRAEVFIPELGLTFKCPSSFRVFACQNPSCQGGGRKGLPKSFLNRFTKVYVDELVEDDYHFICRSLHPSVPKPLLSKLIHFNKRLYEDTMLFHKYGQCGSPWEFNLRDVIRSCQIIEGSPEMSKVDCFLSIVYIQRMRTAADRQNVLKLYKDVFGVSPCINPYPQVQVNRKYLTVGNASIQRNHFQPSKLSDDQLYILPGVRHSLEAVAHCVKYQWLCILVGPTSSGKTSLVRLLAQLTGNVLNELNLSSATDVSELLGCFEQYNAYRNFRVAINNFERYFDEFCSLSLEFDEKELVVERQYMVSKWLAFLSDMDCSPESSSASAFAESWKNKFSRSLSSLVHIIEQLKQGFKRYNLALSWSDKDLDKILKMVLDLQDNNRKQTLPVKFEWVTGLLVKAIECGEWVILENANFCNPTVLDRINSLVEANGSITINECGLVEGKPLVLYPHPNFRLFLTVNPKYGEVSRAMRNRGVELFLMHPCWLDDGDDVEKCKEAEIRDVKRFLVLSGIPISKLVDLMAEAHMFARDTGAKLGVCITLLELTRWVQLFQQLLMKGNSPLWSLQLSWEHTYLSSLGEAEGKDTVEHAKMSFLSASIFVQTLKTQNCSLSLPGGWPSPLKLRKFILFSNETSIKQNCMYLEFLGAQFASYEIHDRPCGIQVVHGQSLSVTGNMNTSSLSDSSQMLPPLIPLQRLYSFLFPTTSDQLNFQCSEQLKFDLALANKMLFFAANWTVEQATESDLKLYLLWFNWYSSQLRPYCQFFESYGTILQREIDHPIWKCIYNCQRELISYYQIDADMQPIPMLSLKLVEFGESTESIRTCKKHLFNAIKSVRFLRLSLQQWNCEDHNCSAEIQCFIPLLKSLRELEKLILTELVETPHFDLLIQLYSNVLENHALFWDGIVTSRLECLIISWRSLRKSALKLKSLFPETVNSLLVECRDLLMIVDGNFDSPKSMLWVNGGHPVLPYSANIYVKMQNLLRFCELIWPIKSKSSKQASIGKDNLVKTVISANAELRSIAMQGVCMLSYFTTKEDEDDAAMVEKLEEIHQVLLERFENEKYNLETALTSSFGSSLEEKSGACCLFCPELLCVDSSFNIWETFSMYDGTSLLLDMELLEQLTSITLVNADNLFSELSSTSGLLELALNFSMKFSSRPPTDFLPHQTLLWVLDAWESVNSVNIVVARSVLDMWFRWHSSLWTCCPEEAEIDGYDIPLPYVLYFPIKAKMLQQILHSAFPIKDYDVNSLKLRVAAANIWYDSPSGRDVSNSLFFAARSLFQQIIFAHKKSFGQKVFSEIKSILSCIEGRPAKQEELQELKSLIASSSHSRLSSLIESFIEPLVGELFLQCSSHDIFDNIGHAWLHIGGLRFHLLLSRDDLDPVVKYSLEYSQLQEKISLFKLELQVRQECEQLVGRSSTRDDLNRKERVLEELEIERRKLLKKVVFRQEPEKFMKLKSECADFQYLVKSLVLTKNLEDIDVSQMISQAHNWQETASSFIKRLSDEYSAYVDIIQPLQVAVYEMKLGLSLLVSKALEKAFLKMTGGLSSSQILETISKFMQYPRFLDFNRMPPETLPSDLDLMASNWPIDINLLRGIYSIARDKGSDNTFSVLESLASLYHNVLVRVTQYVGSSLFIDNASFKVLHEIFDQFCVLWMSMKMKARAKEDDESQHFKFKARTFTVERILDLDVSTLKNSFNDEDLCLEWQEMLAEDDESAQQEHGNLKEEWNLIEDTLLQNVVHVHNQLFGSSNLVEHPAIVDVPDADMIFSFLESYKLGMGMMKGLRTLQSSRLDVELTPEHLFYLCLEHEEKFGLPRCTTPVHNIYKDSNASVVVKMVKPLIALRQRVTSLFNEWPDHPYLQKILNITEMLLSIPLSTPLAKALAGLQFLLRKGHDLEENSPKLSISDQLQPILTLVFSWQKMELDSWPALLDGLQEQCNISAAKLWFPLYSVLHRGQTADISEDDQSTIYSLEDFIKTSSVGEFKKRLQLLLAFHGQINTGVGLKFYTSSNLTANLKILYNVFGYYIQFLPLVTEHIEASKRKIATELKEHMKLSRWERPDSYLLIETSKRTRQKLRKLMRKFNDILQQPVLGIIHHDVMRRGITVPSKFGPKISDGISEMNTVVTLPTFDLTIFDGMGKSKFYSDWREQVDFALHSFCPRRVSDFSLHNLNIIKDSEDAATIITQSLVSQDACFIYQEELKGVWLLLEKICRTTVDCAALWNNDSHSFGKRRALSDLLKLLKSCGLSMHKSLSLEDQVKSNQASSYFLQSSYDVQHLLLSSGITSDSQLQPCNSKSFESHCRIANQYYYRSIAMVELLRQISLNFHKDFSLEQVARTASFLDHLIIIQQEQRFISYGFAEQLEKLRRHKTCLKDLPNITSKVDGKANNEVAISLNQQVTRQCMWRQKNLFDSLYSFTYETSLLLRKVENTHQGTCQTVKVSANRSLAFFEKLIPNLKKSKESLDEYLVGGNRNVATTAACLHPFIVSKQMEQLVVENFREISEFHENVESFMKQTVDKRSVSEALFGRLEDILKKGKVMMEEFSSFLEQRTQSFGISGNGTSSDISDKETAFAESYCKSLKHIRKAFQKLSSSSNSRALTEETSSGKNITAWKVIAESFMMNIQLDLICDAIGETITSAVRFIDSAGLRVPSLCSQIQILMNFLNVLIDLVLTFGDGILHEFFALHRTVAEMTHMLASVFAALYSKGFGTPPEENMDNGDMSQDASGTGMGEGTGLNDVSDQINDEDQLLGTSEKPSEENAQNEAPSKTEKGIEMDQDFAADTYSVSEDSEKDDDDDDKDDDGEDPKLESAMGEVGNGSEVVDEKPWDKEDDETADDKTESYETGSSVRDKDSSNRELRAKEDDATGLDESGELAPDESEKGKGDDQDNSDDHQNTNDLKMDKETAYTDPTGIQFDEQNEGVDEDINMEGLEDSGAAEEVQEDDNLTTENGNDEEDGKTDLADDMEIEESGQAGDNVAGDDLGNDQQENREVSDGPNKSFLEQEKSSVPNDPIMPSMDSATGPNGDIHALDSSTVAPEAQWANSSDMQNGLAPASGLPPTAVPQTELEIPDSNQGGKLTAELPKPAERDVPSVQKSHPNPFRSLGDALEKWKERVKVSIDSHEKKLDDLDEIEDDNADEYGFVSELEKGTSQALGPATSEQIDRNISGSNPHGEEGSVEPEQDQNEMEIEPHSSETLPVRNYGSTTVTKKVDEQLQNAGLNDELLEELQNIDIDGNDEPRTLSENMVSVNKSYTSEEMLQLSKLRVKEDEMGKATSLEEVTGDKGNSTALWKRYELITTRLSQELAEQLRLVMEPTVASKLQGDYKTGKRINMKKVIPYIASHYRKDKIWLRRTRPNKRDYQVVVAVDDSRSMSESHTGAVAIESLVTVCRAMSQLDVGQLAVASFGKKGNIKLLHDFNQPFTAEAGINMISNLTFKQENTIADEPVVDLLAYLNNMLNTAVANARLPSGQNPLQQLVLIIADGRFHEKENLRRCVRDLLSKKRMVAFLLLDSPKESESIMDFMEASFQGGKVTFAKYLNSFPFPYYIVLKNIEALPRTLADLLRQWFELMQNSRD